VLRKPTPSATKKPRPAGLSEALWQSFAVLRLPVRAFGVMGATTRTLRRNLASSAPSRLANGHYRRLGAFAARLLAKMSARITTSEGHHRVAYDISSNPPARLEWDRASSRETSGQHHMTTESHRFSSFFSLLLP